MLTRRSLLSWLPTIPFFREKSNLPEKDGLTDEQMIRFLFRPGYKFDAHELFLDDLASRHFTLHTGDETYVKNVHITGDSIEYECDDVYYDSVRIIHVGTVITRTYFNDKNYKYQCDISKCAIITGVFFRIQDLIHHQKIRCFYCSRVNNRWFITDLPITE